MSNGVYPEFENEASCYSTEYDPEWWHDYETRSGGGKGSKTIHTLNSMKARSICQDLCPAKMECREYAMGFFNLYGIWGGMDHVERIQMQRALGLTPKDFILSYASPIQTNREIGSGRLHNYTYEE